MGLRATIITKYVVEYGETNGFNWGSDFLANLIGEYCPCSSLGGEYNDVDATWSVDKDEFREMLATLKAMPAKEFRKKAVEEWGAEKD